MAACDLCKNLESENDGLSNPNYINTDQPQEICPTCIRSVELMLTQNPSESGNEISGPSSSRRSKPFVEIVAQPIKSYRFRFDSEHNGSAIFPIKGANNTSEKRSFVTIKVNGFKGTFKVLVSCVTKDQFRWAIEFDDNPTNNSDRNEKKKRNNNNIFTHRQHPYELIGDGCRNGICQRKIVDDMFVVFSKLGIKRLKQVEFKQSLTKRKEEKIDPFRSKLQINI